MLLLFLIEFPTSVYSFKWCWLVTESVFRTIFKEFPKTSHLCVHEHYVSCLVIIWEIQHIICHGKTLNALSNSTDNSMKVKEIVNCEEFYFRPLPWLDDDTFQSKLLIFFAWLFKKKKISHVFIQQISLKPFWAIAAILTEP